MMSLTKHLLVLIFAAVFVSCGLDQRNSTIEAIPDPTPVLISELTNEQFKPPDTLNQDRLEPISGNVILSITEGHFGDPEVNTPVFFLSQKTALNYAYYNYVIVQDINVSAGEIEFLHQGVFVPTILLPATGPAQAAAVFNIVSGQYRVIFRYRGMSDSYDVSIDDSLVRVSQVDSNYTYPLHQMFWRYRPHSFAVLCGTTTETSYLCQEFVDSLLASLELTEFFYPDTGMIPFARTTSGYYYEAQTRFFVYDGEENFRDASGILERFTLNRIAGQKGIGISLKSWRNERALSWFFPGGR